MTTKYTTEAHGYRRTVTDYGMGSPGYHVRIDRISDGRRMYAGPFTDGNPFRDPAWIALPNRAEILADLEAARS